MHKYQKIDQDWRICIYCNKKVRTVDVDSEPCPERPMIADFYSAVTGWMATQDLSNG